MTASRPPAEQTEKCASGHMFDVVCSISSTCACGSVTRLPLQPVEWCAKCGCPQSKHHASKPGPKPGSAESYCARCGAEDCWHFTGFAPAQPPVERGPSCCASAVPGEHRKGCAVALAAELAAAKAEVEEAKELLRRICAADMTGDDIGRNRATGEAAMFLRVRQ